MRWCFQVGLRSFAGLGCYLLNPGLQDKLLVSSTLVLLVEHAASPIATCQRNLLELGSVQRGSCMTATHDANGLELLDLLYTHFAGALVMKCGTDEEIALYSARCQCQQWRSSHASLGSPQCASGLRPIGLRQPPRLTACTRSCQELLHLFPFSVLYEAAREAAGSLSVAWHGASLATAKSTW